MSEIRVTDIKGENGLDAVNFSKGINITSGIVTATSVSATNVSIGSSVTASTFFGSGAGLTGVSAGKILQVVSTTKTDTASTNTSGSFVDISGLSVAITPSATSSKIFIILTIGSVSSNGGISVGFKLLRGSTAIGNAASTAKQSGIGNAYAGNQDYLQTISTNFLDSPNTTSATTYKVQWRNSSGTSYLGQYTGNSTEYNASSTITVMEVAV